MRAKRRMTEVEFEAVRPLLKISDDRIEAAYAALVNGETLQTIGNRFGWSRQAVGDAVSVVWRTLTNYHHSQRAAANAGALLPAGWEQVTLTAPSYLVDKFRSEIIESLLQSKEQEVSKKIVEKNVKNLALKRKFKN